MLTSDQEKYLLAIPEDKKVKIYPFDPKVRDIANEIIQKIKKEVAPNLEVLFMGASALGIAGQGDLDIYILCSPKNFDKYLPELEKIFGEPFKKNPNFIEWGFEKYGHEVQLYLTNPNTESMQEQIQLFNRLKNDSALLEEYENLKLSMDKQSFQEYQRKKYEFYNQTLGAPNKKPIK